MTRAINSIGDRLLGLFVPRVTASADCGEYYKFCYCRDGRAYKQFCCRTGGCNACYRTQILC